MEVENVFIGVDVITVLTDIPVLVCIQVVTTACENNDITLLKEDSLSNEFFNLASVIEIYKDNLSTVDINAVQETILVSEILALVIIAHSCALVSRAADWFGISGTSPVSSLCLGKCFSDSFFLGKCL